MDGNRLRVSFGTQENELKTSLLTAALALRAKADRTSFYGAILTQRHNAAAAVALYFVKDSNILTTPRAVNLNGGA